LVEMQDRILDSCLMACHMYILWTTYSDFFESLTRRASIYNHYRGMRIIGEFTRGWREDWRDLRRHLAPNLWFSCGASLSVSLSTRMCTTDCTLRHENLSLINQRQYYIYLEQDHKKYEAKVAEMMVQSLWRL
jgi:hypothetical protein